MHETLIAVCDCIEQQYFVEEPAYGEILSKFLECYRNGYIFHDSEIKHYPRDARLPVVVSEFSHILEDTIQSQFSQLEICDTLSILNPDIFLWSVKEKSRFGPYKIKVLLKHFGDKNRPNTLHVCADGAKQEWTLFKNFLLAKGLVYIINQFFVSQNGFCGFINM